MRRPFPAPAPAPPPEIVQEILLKLPVRDVVRCGCVSRLWRSVVTGSTFRGLHAKAQADADHVAAASPQEALLVSVTREPGRPEEASFFSVSSPWKPAPMPHRVAIPSGYLLSNVCNGLLCFAMDRTVAPVFVCNPVTGETATLPEPPPPPGLRYGFYSHLALAFSPSTKEHKLFRFTSHEEDHGYNVDQAVCTLNLNNGGGWRRRSYRSPCPLLRGSPPLLIRGNLYLVTTGNAGPGRCRNPDGLFEVDVATEACRTHLLPFKADEYHYGWDPLVNTCDMGGRLCLAVDILRSYYTIARKIQFWVLMSSDPEVRWELRYSFHVDGNYTFNVPRSTWFDHADMTLCYRDSMVLFKHGTRGRIPDDDCPQCDRKIQLPSTPSNCKWNVFGGYRPSLLSPLTLASPPSSWNGEEERKDFEHALLLTLS